MFGYTFPKLLRMRGSHWADTLEKVAIFTRPLSISFSPSTVWPVFGQMNAKALAYLSGGWYNRVRKGGVFA